MKQKVYETLRQVISHLKHIKLSEEFLYKNRVQYPPRFSAEEGIIYPFLDRLFCVLRWFSCLAYIQRNKKWKESRIVVDIYVIGWLSIGWIIVIILNCLYCSRNPEVIDYFPNALKYFFIVLLSIRLTDIVQAWWTISFVPKLEAKAPRVIFLVLLNYVEMVVAFGVIGHLCHFWPYFILDKSLIQIWDALRASVAVLTPLGIASGPETITRSRLFYLEYVVGLIFLVIIINVVISYLTSKLNRADSKDK